MPNSPTGGIVRNAIALRRYENGVARDIGAIFDRGARRLQAAVLRRDPTAVTPGNRARRIRALDREMNTILDETYREARALGMDSTVSVAQVEEAFAHQQLQRSVGAAVDINTKLRGREYWRSVMTTDPIQGHVMGDWWKQQRRDTAFQFRRQVQLGMTQGETVDQIVRRVRGRVVRGQLVGGVMGVSRKHAQTLVRTAINQVSNTAAFRTYEANQDVTKTYRYHATLDSSTSEICISLDGKEFAYGEGPTPPQHWGCRSTIVPEVDWEGLGLSKPDPGQRAAGKGTVSADTDYSGWLRDQPDKVQNTVLGKGKAELFRSGKLDLRTLVRQDGTSYTLEQLQDRVT